LLFICDVENANRRIQENQEGLELTGTHQLQVCAEDFSILGENMNNVNKNTEALSEANRLG